MDWGSAVKSKYVGVPNQSRAVYRSIRLLKFIKQKVKKDREILASILFIFSFNLGIDCTWGP